MPNTKRRQKGEGSITEYRKGHFRGFIDLGKDPSTGKRIRKTFTGSSKKEVISKLNQYNYEKQTGALTINSSSLFKYFVSHWLDIKTHTVKASTLEEYEGLSKRYFIPILGSKPINEITTTTINSFLIHPLITSKKKGTQATIKKTLSSIFLLAVKEGIITSNPCTFSEPVRARKPDIHPLDKTQIQQLLQAAIQDGNKRMYYIIKLAIETGARRGEILAITFDDIDKDQSTISFNKSINNTRQVTTTKTQASNRVVYVSPETLRELETLRIQETPIVFHNALGSNYVSPMWVHREFKRLLGIAGLPTSIRFHDLRHTNATILISKGIDMKTVSTRLGHSSITTTMDRYAHAVKEEDKKAARAISNITIVQ